MVLSAFGIVLGVAAILAIGVTNRTAMASMTQIFAETSGRADLVITGTEADAGGFAEKILSSVEAYPGVAFAVPSIHARTALASDAPPSQLGLSFFGTEVSGLTLYGIDPTLDQQVRDYNLVEGSSVSTDRSADETVLVKDFADE